MYTNIINILKVPFTLSVIGTFLFSGTVLAQDNQKNAAKANPAPRAMQAEPRIPSNLKKHSVGVGIGQTFLVGSFEDLGENKITWDLLYTYSASHSFDFFANFHTEKFSFRQQWVKASGLAIGIKGRAYQFDNFSPYGVFGFGFYSPKVKRLVNNVLMESESKTTFGWHIGAGADLRLNSRFSTGILFHYHNPFDVKQEVGPVVEGSYAKMLITGMFTF